MFLFSPHSKLGEYYARHYHLRYAHAKKLFVFDLLLLATIFFLIGTTLAWFAYDPTVKRAITFSITSSDRRLQSGDLVQITVAYQNKSSVSLNDTVLSVQLPAGFIIQTVSAGGAVSSSTPFTFFIGELKSQAQGSVTVSGRYFATPHKHTSVLAHLTYNQNTRQAREEKTAALFLTVQGTPVSVALVASNYAVLGGSTPISLSVSNQGKTSLENITIPLIGLMPGLQLSDIKITSGRLTQPSWLIPKLSPFTTTTLLATAIIASQPESNNNLNRDLSVTANIVVDSVTIPQATARHHFTLLSPQVEIKADWKGRASASPGDKLLMALQIKNNSDQALAISRTSIPLPDGIIDPQSLSLGNIRNGVYEITITPPNGTLAPGQTRDIAIPLTLLQTPAGGTDISLSLSPRLSFSIQKAPGATIVATAHTPALPIGSALIAQANLRYYTADGDQLGRGPLPPRVGKQTRYWAIFTIKNSTSELREVTLSGELAPGAVWTGKTSVSLGANVRYDDSTRIFHWQVESLEAHDSANINFEIGFTPAEKDRGGVVPLLNNISVQGRDNYIDTVVKTNLDALDTALPADKSARARGVAVQ